jgi:hypothetical protein
MYAWICNTNQRIVLMNDRVIKEEGLYVYNIVEEEVLFFYLFLYFTHSISIAPVRSRGESLV